LKPFVPIFVFVLSATATVAQDVRAIPETDTQTYQMVREGSGFVRLNRTTGTMSYCRVVTGNLVCRPAAEEREAYLEALDRLGDRLDEAEGRLSRLERTDLSDRVVTQSPPAGGAVDEANTDDEPTGGIGGNSQLERVTDLAGRVIRNFFSIVATYRDSFDAETR
jgi:hypothetical protein